MSIKRTYGVIFHRNKNTTQYVKYNQKGKPMREHTKHVKRNNDHVLRRVVSMLGTLLFVLFCGAVLTFALRGHSGNPTSEQLNTPAWNAAGPLELSPDRGRYALLYSIVEDRSLQFSNALGKFADPDVAILNGHYVSLFAPGISYIVMPGYIIGKYFNLAQIGSFSVIALFALLNVLLLRSIAIRLGAHPIAATLASFVFLFASPAFTYAVTLYQHHISTFLILSSIYILIRWNNLWSLAAIWFLCALSIPVDYPNLFLMFPIGIYALTRLLIIEKENMVLRMRIKLVGVFTFVTMAIPIGLFLLFNQASYGNPLQLSGTLKTPPQIRYEQQIASKEAAMRAKHIAIPPKTRQQEKAAVNFFKPRLIIDGLYIQFFSPDRGILLFTPIILFGIIGIIFSVKEKNKLDHVLLAIISANILLYAMWDDPYGGWAFGGRYLIPAYALLSIFLAIGLSKLRRSNMFLLLIYIVMFYSIAVNTLGAITSSKNPPKVEAVGLEKVTHREEKYTYWRNYDFLLGNGSKSYMYEAFADKYLTPWGYYVILTASILGVGTMLLLLLRIKAEEKTI